MFRGLPGRSSIHPFFISADRCASTVDLWVSPSASAISGLEGATPCFITYFPDEFERVPLTFAQVLHRCRLSCLSVVSVGSP